MRNIPYLPSASPRAMLSALIVLTTLSVTSCAELPPTPKPDYTVRVKTQNGKSTAIPPPCASWNTDIPNPFDNQPLPQFGCANARNLALMIERPEDLIEGRTPGDPDSVTSLGAVVRYRNDQTRGLLWTGTDPNTVATTTASTPSSGLTGEIGASSGSGAGSGTSTGSSSSSSGP